MFWACVSSLFDGRSSKMAPTLRDATVLRCLGIQHLCLLPPFSFIFSPREWSMTVWWLLVINRRVTDWLEEPVLGFSCLDCLFGLSVGMWMRPVPVLPLEAGQVLIMIMTSSSPSWSYSGRCPLQTHSGITGQRANCSAKFSRYFRTTIHTKPHISTHLQHCCFFTFWWQSYFFLKNKL